RPGQPAGGFGRVRDARGERERYLAHLLASQSDGRTAGAARHDAAPLAGMRVVVDCAHGAASELAPVLLRRARARAVARSATPAAVPRIWRRCPLPWSSTAPTPVSRMTATPTGAWRSTRQAR